MEIKCDDYFLFFNNNNYKDDINDNDSDNNIYCVYIDVNIWFKEMIEIMYYIIF